MHPCLCKCSFSSIMVRMFDGFFWNPLLPNHRARHHSLRLLYIHISDYFKTIKEGTQLLNYAPSRRSIQGKITVRVIFFLDPCWFLTDHGKVQWFPSSGSLQRRNQKDKPTFYTTKPQGIQLIKLDGLLDGAPAYDAVSPGRPPFVDTLAFISRSKVNF